MPHATYDPLGRRWVLLAPERAGRGVPDPPPDAPDPEPCDFCGGREDRTPPETAAIRPDGTAPDSPGWRVRAVPNLYPATTVHEVVVHTPDHTTRFEELGRDHRADVLRLYRQRLRAIDVASAVVVFNRGRRAGASRTHPHGQLFGLDVVPPVLEREAEALAGGCVVCDLAHDDGHRAGIEGTAVVAVHPAPKVAHEVLVVPPCAPRFEDADDPTLEDAAEALGAALATLRRAFGDALPLNVALHTAPRDTGAFHWHLHVYPRTAHWAGLEMGAEIPIVDADPLLTAARLRES